MRAVRSHSRECPRSMVFGVINGLGPVIKACCIVFKVWVAVASFSDVIPDHLDVSSCLRVEKNNILCTIVEHMFSWLDKMVKNIFTGSIIDNRDTSKLLTVFRHDLQSACVSDEE